MSETIIALLAKAKGGMSAKEVGKALGEPTSIMTEQLLVMAAMGSVTARVVGRAQVFALAKHMAAPATTTVEPALPEAGAEPAREVEAPAPAAAVPAKPTIYDGIGGTLTLDISSGPVAVRFDSVHKLNGFLSDLIELERTAA
jgi:hypothetical protein